MNEDLDYIDSDYLDPMFGLENFEDLAQEQIDAFVVFCFATTAMRSGAKMYFEWFAEQLELLYSALEKIGGPDLRILVANFENASLSEEDDVQFHQQLDAQALYHKTLQYAHNNLEKFKFI